MRACQPAAGPAHEKTGRSALRLLDLLKKLSLDTWNNEERKNMPFYLEMLLFILGPQEIVDDIKKSTTIEIRTIAGH
jgi:hypothetical protein